MSDRQSEWEASNPMSGLDEWEAFLKERYPQPREQSSFRDYGANVRPTVREFYRLNHRHQTLREKRGIVSPGTEATVIWPAG